MRASRNQSDIPQRLYRLEQLRSLRLPYTTTSSRNRLLLQAASPPEISRVTRDRRTDSRAHRRSSVDR